MLNKSLKFIVSQKEMPQGILITITDIEIMGKKYEEGKKQLDLSNKFYQGEEKDEKETMEIIKSGYILQFTGLKAVGLGLKLGLIKMGRTVSISGIPHAEVVVER